MINAGTSIEAAKRNAKAYSVKNPGMYVTIFACFGLFLNASKRLGVFAPSDSVVPCYWHNGVEKQFTKAQVIRDQNETPCMA